MRLLDNVKVTQIGLNDRMARRYTAELSFKLWCELDWITVQQSREGALDHLRRIGIDFAHNMHDVFYEEILTRVRVLYYIAISSASPAYRDEIRHIGEALFALLRPSREEEEAMISKVTQAPSGRTSQGDSSLQAVGQQYAVQHRNSFSAALFNHVIGGAPAQTPPEEEIQPGHLDDEEDLGDNVIDKIEDEGIAEAQAFVRAFLRDVGGSDEPDPEM